MPQLDSPFTEAREEMLAHQVLERGVRSPRVASAMREVPREAFVDEHLREFAYSDAPLPIAEGQTISQPYIVAYMAEALELEAGERVLEVGTGSGYAAAVLSRIAGVVYTVERHPKLAHGARRLLQRLGYTNVQVREGDGTRGWPEAAPFDAIAIAARGGAVPPALHSQLALGGRLVVPVGETPREQRLLRITRVDEDEFEEESLLRVRFVPLVGTEGWVEQIREPSRTAGVSSARRLKLTERIARAAEPFDAIDTAKLGGLLERIGDARIVLL